MGSIGSFFGDMLRHWVGKMTGAMSLMLSVAPLIYPDWFAGSKGFFHQRAVYWLAGAVCLLVASFAAWSEKDQQLRAAQKELDIAVNKERPEVFAHFGHCRLPKNDYSSTGLPDCVQVSNLGSRDAWDIRISSFSLQDVKVEFFDVQFLRANQNAAMLDCVEGFPRGNPKSFKDVLAIAEKSGYHTTLALLVTWRDSGGNYFQSRSELTYFPLDQSCYTEIGPVQSLGGVSPDS